MAAVEALGARATEWLDRWWDEAAGMVGYPSTEGSPTNPYQQPGVHQVRESAVYAAALLERGAPGDGDRAERALEAVLAHQIDAPGSVTHGTWRRAPIEPVPGPEPREWIDYDPNWREFVGAAFVLALRHEARLAPGTVRAMERALRLAAEGTLDRAVPAEYTNIALLSAFLLDWAGDRLGEGAWRKEGEALGAAVADAYDVAGAFPEHNSPTYYGIDLYGMALWRDRARSEVLRARGAALEAGLWRDLARFYHAGLRNLCGPYSRAYGMDMTRYVAGLGCWIASVVSPDRAPLPTFGDAVAHAHDFFELPLVAALGPRPPADVRAHLDGFRGERAVEQVVTREPRRVASARLRERIMWGGEATGGHIVHWQHHPATIHWKTPDGGVGWLRLRTTAPVDAVAGEDGLAIAVRSDLAWLRKAEIPVWLELHPAPADPGPPSPLLRLPGLVLRVTSEPTLAWRFERVGGGSARVGAVLAPGGASEGIELRLDVEEGP
jgi:hypothetical protein